MKLREDTLVLIIVIIAGTCLSLFGGLDVDNAWGAIIAFVGGIGTHKYLEDKADEE